jgi:hypothetical protein
VPIKQDQFKLSFSAQIFGCDYWLRTHLQTLISNNSHFYGTGKLILSYLMEIGRSIKAVLSQVKARLNK